MQLCGGKSLIKRGIIFGGDALDLPGPSQVLRPAIAAIGDGHDDLPCPVQAHALLSAAGLMPLVKPRWGRLMDLMA